MTLWIRRATMGLLNIINPFLMTDLVKDIKKLAAELQELTEGPTSMEMIQARVKAYNSLQRVQYAIKNNQQ